MNHRKRATLLFAAIVSLSSSSRASSLLLCGGPQVVQAKLIDTATAPVLQELWHWRPEQSEGLPVPMMRKFITTDDCKAVSHGEEVLITSSGDAVALVSHATGKTLFYATVKNAHSAELLPGGLIVVAASSDPSNLGDKVVLFNRNKSNAPIGSVPLSAAHGVVWDRKRKVLWALGGRELARLRVESGPTGPHLVMEHAVSLPHGEGHDLQISDNCDALYVTNTTTVYQVNPDTLSFRAFAAFAGRTNIKSLSINEQSGQIAFTQADPGVWWTYSLRFLNPSQRIVLPNMIYKVRWF